MSEEIARLMNEINELERVRAVRQLTPEEKATYRKFAVDLLVAASRVSTYAVFALEVLERGTSEWGHAMKILAGEKQP